jgi:hypothetical protein
MSEQTSTSSTGLWGIMVEFDTPEALLEACHRVREAGYRRFDAYAPFPVHGLDEAMALPPTRLPRLVLLFAILGGSGAYFMQYFASVIHYPLNIGGRPMHSWPAFLPITFELAILMAAFAAVVGMILRNGLPLLYHPVFNVDRFRRASQDKFFLCVEAADPLFDPAETRQFLAAISGNPQEVFDVAR